MTSKMLDLNQIKIMVQEFVNECNHNHLIKNQFENALFIGDVIKKSHPEVHDDLLFAAIMAYTFYSDELAFNAFKSELNNHFYPEFASIIYLRTTNLIKDYNQLKGVSIKSLMSLLESYECKYSLLLLKYFLKYPVKPVNTGISNIRVIKKSSNVMNDEIYLKVIDATLKRLLSV